MKLTSRNTHRDIAYFYVGLIIAFAFSGIFLNHRRTLNPRRYTHEVKEIKLMPFNKDLVTDEFVAKLTSDQKIEDELRRFVASDEELSISYASNDVKINMATGEGTIITYRTIPLLGQMTILHMDTSKW